MLLENLRDHDLKIDCYTQGVIYEPQGNNKAKTSNRYTRRERNSSRTLKKTINHKGRENYRNNQ